ncbi:hypothetical protein R1flu_026644 [Riccia fluitans]|uniref:Uncharacterized protein n=1 Tax=Riccia fluitans TaxID=41844 RepID=A0ABD1XJF8_9MARC
MSCSPVHYSDDFLFTQSLSESNRIVDPSVEYTGGSIEIRVETDGSQLLFKWIMIGSAEAREIIRSCQEAARGQVAEQGTTSLEFFAGGGVSVRIESTEFRKHANGRQGSAAVTTDLIRTPLWLVNLSVPDIWVDGCPWTFKRFEEDLRPFSKQSGDFSWTGVTITGVHMEVESLTAGNYHLNGPLKMQFEWAVGPDENSKIHKVSG